MAKAAVKNPQSPTTTKTRLSSCSWLHLVCLLVVYLQKTSITQELLYFKEWGESNIFPIRSVPIYLHTHSVRREYKGHFSFNIQFICKSFHFVLEHKEQKTKQTQREKRAMTEFLHPLPKTLQGMEKTMSYFKPPNWLIKAVDDHTHQLGKEQFSIHTVLIPLAVSDGKHAMLLSEVCPVRKSSSNPPKTH